MRQAPQTVQNVVTYDVVIAVPNPDLALKPGMTASTRIVTSRVDAALRVPDQASRFRPGQAAPAINAAPVHDDVPRAARRERGDKVRSTRTATVWTLEERRPKQLLVQLGLDDDQYSQVLAGELHEGQQVIVSELVSAPARGRAPTSGMFGPGR